MDRITKRMSGTERDYWSVHALGTVPALEVADGRVLTETAAVLQHLARQNNVELSDEQLTELHRWLSFVGTEIHKGIFNVFFDPNAPEASRAYALETGATRLSFVNDHLTGRDFLLDELSVADMYLYTALNWSLATPVSLEPYPALVAFHQRMRELPAVSRAFAEERELYAKQQAARAS